MKKLAVIAVSLFSLASTCNREDTIARDLGRRTFVPRLTGTSEYAQCTEVPVQEGRVVPTFRCGIPVEEKPDACDDLTNTRTEAAAILVGRPQCVDRAIHELQKYLFSDPNAPNDLAAAYYFRAQRDDNPLDFLLALEAAEQGIVTGDPAALFNYALIHETLGFHDAAIAAWDRYLQVETSPQWAAEARIRRAALIDARNHDARRLWERNRNALPAALQKGDRAAVARLIDPFPRSAWTYFEEEVLGRWAADPTPQHLSEARLYAEELSKRTQDRFALDVVATLSPAVREAHRLYSEGIGGERAHRINKLKQAAALFAQARSPMLLSAKIYLGQPDVDGAKSYPHLHAQSLARRGYKHFDTDDYVAALSDYQDAKDEFHRLSDRESEYALFSSTIGMYWVLGQYDQAALDAFRSRDYGTNIVDPQRRNRYLGEVTSLAMILGHKRAAFLYQNASVAERRDEMTFLAGDDAREGAKYNLGIALRGRAGAYAQLGRPAEAFRDLAEAEKYSGATTETNRRALQGRLQEVRAQMLQSTGNLGAALTAFDKAIRFAGIEEYSTFRANLYVQRAAVYRGLGRNGEAETDLMHALEVVRAEADKMLAGPKQTAADKIIWDAYFSRFEQVYDSLIAQRMDANRVEEAFDVAEESRAYEPLKRLLEFGNAAAAFRRELGSQRYLPLAQVRKHLPADTALVAYAVLEDRTYAWIVTRDGVTHVRLNARRNTINQWSQALQDAWKHGSEAELQLGLAAPYAELIAPVLARTRGTPRLVLIPDDAMHGLPFAALRDARARQYFIQQAVLSSQPSATFYIHSLMRDRELPRNGNPTALLVGDPKFDPSLSIARKLRRLPGARHEVQQLEMLYGSPALTDERATVAEFLRLAPQSEIVEVAAHGIVNGRMPTRSALLLAPDAQHNGALDAETLLEQLHAEQTRLMVLSACSSAGGLPVGPDGVAPLVRPILAAGIPGVVGTLSYVDDPTSAELMVSFHRHYRQGSDAALALHDAQVEMATKQGANALNWAPFQVIGYASSPFPDPNTNRGEPP